MEPKKSDRYQSVKELISKISEIGIKTEPYVHKPYTGKTIHGINNEDTDPAVLEGTDSDTVLGIEFLKLRKDTGKVRIEYYPSFLSGEDEIIYEVSSSSVRYQKGRNLVLSLHKGVEKWHENIISQDKYKYFLEELEQLNIGINPEGSVNEEFGTVSTRVKITLYDDKDRAYKKLWKYSWSDEYGGGESGALLGEPQYIYEKISGILAKIETSIIEPNHKLSFFKTVKSVVKPESISDIYGPPLPTVLSKSTRTPSAPLPNVKSRSKSQEKKDESVLEHKWVDLGLSVKWATCNVGANKPEEFGDFYAWGETKKKRNYSNNKYEFLEGSGILEKILQKYNKYNNVDRLRKLELLDDVAHSKWDGSWRMPTKSEFKELIDNCTWNWTTMNGVKGYIVTSKKSGYTDCSIFLPAAGYRQGTSHYYAGSCGDYWSSSRNTSGMCYAYYLGFNPGMMDLGHDSRYYGHSVRAVCP